jgi:hypothetical protein
MLMKDTIRRHALRAIGLAPAIVLAFSAMPAFAQVVGAVGAVTPLSLGTPPGEKTRNLILGARVISNETIQTSGDGSANIIFLDRTTMSIGRNSTLIIDKYVYDPSTGKGALTATMAQGVLRFIGGQISHTSGVKVLTPVATIGVRGGMMTVNVGADGVTVMSHYGHIDVANGRNHQLILRSGFTVHVHGHDEYIAAPGQTSLAALDAEYRHLAGRHHHHQPEFVTNSTAAQYGLANDALPNNPDSMPGLDTIGMINLGQNFVGNRSQQQQWNGANAALNTAPPPPPNNPPPVDNPPPETTEPPPPPTNLGPNGAPPPLE